MILIALKKIHKEIHSVAKKTYKNCITYALLGPVRLPSAFTFHATDLNKKNSSVEFWSIATKTCNPYLEG